jgi:molybdopterin-guanine dinucleotide biosynthesis protein A
VSALLPVHGFVLAGGKSSRMGVDKALLPFSGRPMVEIGVEKLRGFCAAVSIAGNRDDLSRFAPVALESRLKCGPAAGVEAGLAASTEEWAMFVPVDVPLVPAELLRRWMAGVLEQANAGCGVSFLLVNGLRQPTFCAVRRSGLPLITKALERGERRLADILYAIEEADQGWLWAKDATGFVDAGGGTALQMEYWFYNVNTPQELEEAETWPHPMRIRDE